MDAIKPRRRLRAGRQAVRRPAVTDDSGDGELGRPPPGSGAAVDSESTPAER